MSWFVLLFFLVALSWLGWRWNQLEVVWADSGRLPYVKRQRQRSKRRKHHHYAPCWRQICPFLQLQIQGSQE